VIVGVFTLEGCTAEFQGAVKDLSLIMTLVKPLLPIALFLTMPVQALSLCTSEF